MKVIVFGNCLQNTVGLVRSLGEIGYKVTLLMEPCRKSDCFIRFSRYVEKIHYLDKITDAINVLLENYSNEETKSVIFCGSDPTISLLDAHYNRLKDFFYIFNANGIEGRINKYLDKSNTFLLAEKYGLTLIRTKELVGGKGIPEDIEYPCFVKGNNSVVSGKLDIHICNNPEDLLTCLRTGVNYLVQEYIQKDYEINMIGLSINHGNTIIIPGVIRKLREDLVRMGEYMRLDPCELYPFVNFDGIKKMISEIGYEGIFSVEMLVKGDKCYFLETNLRNDGLAYIYTAAGANFPSLWVDYLTGNLSSEKINGVSVKTPFFLMHENDLYNIVEKKVSVFQWIKDFNRSGAFFIMNIKDPLPFIFSTLIHIRQFCKMILRRCFNLNIK